MSPREVHDRQGGSLPKPYYEDDAVTLYQGDCREILPALDLEPDLVLTDPPYPNKAGHFLDGIETARWLCSTLASPRWMVFWHQLETPPVPLPLVATHIWHRTNTNRPDNYEAIYEFADEDERPSRVFPHPVIYPGLTGCDEATGHPTQKNVKLMRALIQLRPAMLILDPFAGSGTTLRAAKDLGVRSVGIEIDEGHCRDAADRLCQEVLDVAA